MKLLGVCSALLVAASCAAEDPAPVVPPGHAPPIVTPVPDIQRGRHEVSALQVEPGGARVWAVHEAIADIAAKPPVRTSRLAVYTVASQVLREVLDTTDTDVKAILFPGTDRVLLVTRRADRDVLVVLDAVTGAPIAQRAYAGDMAHLQLSPSGRFLLFFDEVDHRDRVLDTTTLVDQVVASAVSPAWAHAEDRLFAAITDHAASVVQAYDLRAADLAQPLPAPAVVTRIAGSAFVSFVVSPDDRSAAMAITQQPFAKVALITLATGATTLIDGLAPSGFTRDNRALVETSGYDWLTVDPATGSATKLAFSALALIDILPEHDTLVVKPLAGHPFLYDLASDAQTPLAAPQADEQLDRPGHRELWQWGGLGNTLAQIDLDTGAVHTVAQDIERAGYRRDADELVVWRTNHHLQQLPLDASRGPGPDLIVTDPNDDVAPYRLAP